MLFKVSFLSQISTLSFSFLFFSHSFVEETSHLSCKVFHILDFADCMVSFNLFLCPYISCKQVVSSRGLSRIRFDFLAKRLEPRKQGNEMTRSKSGSVRKERDNFSFSASPSNPLGLLSVDAGGRQRGDCPQTSIVLASGMLSCWAEGSHITRTFHRRHITLPTSKWLSHTGVHSFLLSWFCTGFLPFFPQILYLHLHTHKHPIKMLFSLLLSQFLQMTLLSHQGQLNCLNSELGKTWTVFAEIASALEMLYVWYHTLLQKNHLISKLND